jgi:peptidoglycan/xylan/chitin deacetylase (PgdA/CDA1 family)
MYHRIAVASPDIHRLSIPPRQFREHMRTLRSRYVPVSLLDLKDAIRCGDVPPRAVAVTFDDGLIDALTTASPVLVEFGIPATFFISTSRLNDKHECWWDELERIFCSIRCLPPVLDLSDEFGEVYPTNSWFARLQTLRIVTHIARGLDADGVRRLCARVAGWSGLDLAPRDSHRALLASEVRLLASQHGHDIGAHGVHHVSLPMQPIGAQRNELVESKQTLEHLLGRAVNAFSYPFGHNSEDTRHLAASCFDVAVTATPGAAKTGDDLFAVPRLDGVLASSDLSSALDAALAIPRYEL